MHSRVSKTILCWLLPLFVARGLLPAGFMLDASGGSLSMVICSGGVYKTVQVAADSIEVGQIDEKKSGRHAAASLCPFAVAAGTAPLTAVPDLSFAQPQAAFDRNSFATQAIPYGPVRTQQSRAPPNFS